MVFKNGLMAQSMKAIGLKIKLRAKVHFGMPKVTFMLVSSKLIKLVDLEYIPT